MKIAVNNKEQEVNQGTTIRTLATLIKLPEQGIAIAVNNRMVPRSDWKSHTLCENDQIIIIKAACGG